MKRMIVGQRVFNAGNDHMTFEEALKEYKRVIEELVCYKEDHNDFVGVHGRIIQLYERQIKEYESLLQEMFKYSIPEIDIV